MAEFPAVSRSCSAWPVFDSATLTVLRQIFPNSNRKGGSTVAKEYSNEIERMLDGKSLRTDRYGS